MGKLENDIEHRPQGSHWRDDGTVVFIHPVPVISGGNLLGVSSLVLLACVSDRAAFWGTEGNLILAQADTLPCKLVSAH